VGWFGRFDNREMPASSRNLEIKGTVVPKGRRGWFMLCPIN